MHQTKCDSAGKQKSNSKTSASEGKMKILSYKSVKRKEKEKMRNLIFKNIFRAETQS